MTQIRIRHGIASLWTSRNPVLSAGEPGYETDTGQFKIGNAVTAWNLLPYVGASSETAAFSLPGVQVVGPGTNKWYNDSGHTLTIKKARASLVTAPTGAAFIVDVNLDGTTIFTTQANRPSIAIAGLTATGVPDVTAWPDGSYLTADIDQVGSTIAGSDLTVIVTA